MNRLRAAAASTLACACLLVACSAPTVPDFTYFRLPPPTPLPVAPVRLFDQPLVVDAFGADGLYADQALIYALDGEAQQLRQYHYQLWTDPPTRVLQRRLIAELRDTGLAPAVTDELPASRPAIRVSAIILRLDRVPAGADAWTATVALKLRANALDGTPLVDEVYRADEAVAGPGLASTVDAYGRAVDAIYARFHAELVQRAAPGHAR